MVIMSNHQKWIEDKILSKCDVMIFIKYFCILFDNIVLKFYSYKVYSFKGFKDNLQQSKIGVLKIWIGGDNPHPVPRLHYLVWRSQLQAGGELVQLRPDCQCCWFRSTCRTTCQRPTDTSQEAGSMLLRHETIKRLFINVVTQIGIFLDPRPLSHTSALFSLRLFIKCNRSGTLPPRLLPLVECCHLWKISNA